jgi:predicted aminopeptidase
VTWRRATTALGCIAVVALAGCATPGYNESRIQAELVRAGATHEQAKCVTDALTNRYDEAQLGSHSEPTPQEIQQARLILKDCKVTLPVKPQP